MPRKNVPHNPNSKHWAHTNKRNEVISKVRHPIGSQLSKEHKLKISEALKGRKPSNWDAITQKRLRDQKEKRDKPHPCQGCGTSFSGPRKYCSDKCLRDNFKPNTSGLLRKSGPAHHNWKGGVSGPNKKARETPQYKRWREKVFKRDKYTCQQCFKIGGDLEAHHIKPFASHKKTRYVVENGITFCKKCHKKPGLHKPKPVFAI